MDRTLAFQFHHAKLRQNCESFFQELSDTDSMIIYGGKSDDYSENSSLGRKLLEYALVGFAIHNIVSLVKLFIDSPQQRSPDSISSSQ